MRPLAPYNGPQIHYPLEEFDKTTPAKQALSLHRRPRPVAIRVPTRTLATNVNPLNEPAAPMEGMPSMAAFHSTCLSEGTSPLNRTSPLQRDFRLD